MSEDLHEHMQSVCKAAPQHPQRQRVEADVMKLRQQRAARLDVWINPAPHRDANALVEALHHDFHLIVVPKTGNRQADVAVLCDPAPQDVSRLRHILSGVPVLATMTATPSVALRKELRRSGGLVLTRPTTAELVDAVRRLSRGSATTMGVIS
jgi:hypothetical protein